jgi:NAD-dependent dihydropyrimidine dehydrogenase PreA subunit
MTPESLHGVFIDVEVDPSVRGDRQLAARLAEVCPVDIYAVGADGGVAVVRENLDECVLCRLCLEASPPGTVRVLKKYSGEALE